MYADASLLMTTNGASQPAREGTSDAGAVMARGAEVKGVARQDHQTDEDRTVGCNSNKSVPRYGLLVRPGKWWGYDCGGWSLLDCHLCSRGTPPPFMNR